MSLVGVFTKKDLSAVGHAAYSALIGIIIAMLLNMFLLHSNAVEFFISILMVLISQGLLLMITNVYAKSMRKQVIKQVLGWPFSSHYNYTLTSSTYS